jgi:hypothetical protein
MIAGLDTGGNRWHMSVEDGRHLCLPALNATKPPWDNAETRRVEICLTFSLHLVTEGLVGQDTLIFCETPLALKNPATTFILQTAAGAMWHCAHMLGCQWVWVNNSTWKKEIVGKMKAGKQKPQIIAAMREKYDSDHFEEDFYDSDGILEYGKLWLDRQTVVAENVA